MNGISMRRAFRVLALTVFTMASAPAAFADTARLEAISEGQWSQWNKSGFNPTSSSYRLLSNGDYATGASSCASVSDPKIRNNGINLRQAFSTNLTRGAQNLFVTAPDRSRIQEINVRVCSAVLQTLSSTVQVRGFLRDRNTGDIWQSTNALSFAQGTAGGGAPTVNATVLAIPVNHTLTPGRNYDFEFGFTQTAGSANDNLRLGIFGAFVNLTYAPPSEFSLYIDPPTVRVSPSSPEALLALGTRSLAGLREPLAVSIAGEVPGLELDLVANTIVTGASLRIIATADPSLPAGDYPIRVEATNASGITHTADATVIVTHPPFTQGLSSEQVAPPNQFTFTATPGPLSNLGLGETGSFSVTTAVSKGNPQPINVEIIVSPGLAGPFAGTGFTEITSTGNWYFDSILNAFNLPVFEATIMAGDTVEFDIGPVISTNFFMVLVNLYGEQPAPETGADPWFGRAMFLVNTPVEPIPPANPDPVTPPAKPEGIRCNRTTGMFSFETSVNIAWEMPADGTPANHFIVNRWGMLGRNIPFGLTGVPPIVSKTVVPGTGQSTMFNAIDGPNAPETGLDGGITYQIVAVNPNGETKSDFVRLMDGQSQCEE